jgi:hypothetical protein
MKTSGIAFGAPKDCEGAPRLAGGVAAEVARVQRRQVASRQRHRAALGAAGRIRDRCLRKHRLRLWTPGASVARQIAVHCNVGRGMSKT